MKKIEPKVFVVRGKFEAEIIARNINAFLIETDTTQAVFNTAMSDMVYGKIQTAVVVCMDNLRTLAKLFRRGFIDTQNYVLFYDEVHLHQKRETMRKKIEYYMQIFDNKKPFDNNMLEKMYCTDLVRAFVAKEIENHKKTVKRVSFSTNEKRVLEERLQNKFSANNRPNVSFYFDTLKTSILIDGNVATAYRFRIP